MDRLSNVYNHLAPKMSSLAFDNIPLAPPDPIFHLTASYVKDSDPSKINLGVGAYRDNNGKPWVLPVVKKVSLTETGIHPKAENLIVADASLDHEYLSIDGLKSFTEASARLILGKDSPAMTQKRYAACQAISGTGGTRFARQLNPSRSTGSRIDCALFQSSRLHF